MPKDPTRPFYLLEVEQEVLRRQVDQLTPSLGTIGIFMMQGVLVFLRYA